jgi:hypothetical protein
MAIRLLLWLSEAPVNHHLLKNCSYTFGKAQNILCPTGASILPPEVKLSTTKDPESEEVTKNPAIKIIAMILRINAKG